LVFELQQIQIPSTPSALGQFTFKAYITHFLPSLCTTIICQATELESCSNPQKMRQVLTGCLKFGKVWIHFFVGDIISGVGLGILAQVTWPWALMPGTNFLTLEFLVQTR